MKAKVDFRPHLQCREPEIYSRLWEMKINKFLGATFVECQLETLPNSIPSKTLRG
jgi:hypothetical protein